MDPINQIYNPLHGLMSEEQEGVIPGALQAMQDHRLLKGALTMDRQDLYGD